LRETLLAAENIKRSGVFVLENEAGRRLTLIVCQDACVALAVVTPIMSSTGRWGGLQPWAYQPFARAVGQQKGGNK